jgi:hypothetical protein
VSYVGTLAERTTVVGVIWVESFVTLALRSFSPRGRNLKRVEGLKRVDTTNKS